MTAPPSAISLPPIPESHAGRAVAAWSEPITIDSYLPTEPDHFPAYLDSRVYQGSSGAVFPLPFHERISRDKVPHTWQAVHLENEWMRVVILPELGGRIHIAYDKVAGYDMFYRNNVIKPALVGLAGPWISGGVEFNWPQHHRPATFLPTDVSIEEEPDGSVTVWCSDHDPFARMKGMHGIRLRADSSAVEARVRLYNRSETSQTFLWWANVAAAVNDNYQSFFPLDVRYVADHAKRAVVTYPEPDALYYGIDYTARGQGGLDWYRNIPVPTSYMITETREEFFGGYDHGRDAGFVHWASERVSPGKKQWTWGNGDFGRAWDSNLTDSDGPYIELMAGVFTDNQPDFAYIAPGEVKTFSQFWYPLHGIGPVHQASATVAARLDASTVRVWASLVSADRLSAALVTLSADGGEQLRAWTIDLEPGALVTLESESTGVPLHQLVLEVKHAGQRVLRLQHPSPEGEPHPVPDPATEPPAADEVGSVDELVQIARYLEQYRHATRSADPYWREALDRDPNESRAAIGLGGFYYRRGQYEAAEDLLRRAVKRLTRWAPTSAEGTAHYVLALVLVRLGRSAEAIRALERASWDSSHYAASTFALARLHARAGDRPRAIELLRELVAAHPEHLQSATLLSLLRRENGEGESANALLASTLATDPLDQWALHAAGRAGTRDATIALDVALEYAAAGFTDLALAALDGVALLAGERALGQVNVVPLAHYHRAVLLWRAGRHEEASAAADAAAASDWTYCLPSRLDDIDALSEVVARRPDDGLAAALLGHWYYHAGRHDDAINLWRLALDVTVDDALAVVLHRNLGIASYNILREPGEASAHYESALRIAPDTGRLWYEFDQLRARMGDLNDQRLARLEDRRHIVETRDDLIAVYARLLVEVGRAKEAKQLLAGYPFQPWEGGEGRVLGVWDDAAIALAHDALAAGAPLDAARAIYDALNPPSSLGEARHPLANTSALHLVAGDAFVDAGNELKAEQHWRIAADASGDFTGMAVGEFSPRTWHSIQALRRLGEDAAADSLTGQLRAWLQNEADQPASVDYFATSLPEMLLFVDDPARARDAELEKIRVQLAQDLP